MVLWIVIVQDEDAPALLPAMLDAGLEAYAVASTGSLLRRGSVTLLVAVPDGQRETARALLDDFAQTRAETRTAGLSETAQHELGDLAPAPLLITLGGAILYGLRVTRWEHW